jgi:hypothetical protein
VGGAACGMRASAVRQVSRLHPRPRRWRAACRRRGGNPPRPGLPPEGETGKGEIQIPRCRRLFLSRPPVGEGGRGRLSAWRSPLSPMLDGPHAYCRPASIRTRVKRSASGARWVPRFGSGAALSVTSCSPSYNGDGSPRSRSHPDSALVSLQPKSISSFPSHSAAGCFYAATLRTRAWALA